MAGSRAGSAHGPAACSCGGGRPGLCSPAPAGASAADAFPVFDVGGDYHGLGQGNGVYFDLYGLNAAPQAGRDHDPDAGGYGVSLVHRAQFVLGDAEVDTNRGVYKGEFEVAPRAAFDADPATAGCADGDARSDVVDGAERHARRAQRPRRRRPPRGPGYRLTVCLGSLQKLKLTARRGLLRDPGCLPQPD